MKKLLAIFLAALIAFSTCFITVFADDVEPDTGIEESSSDEIASEDDTTAAPAKEESTTRDIMNDDGLVVPINFNQLKSSFIFKIIEKVIKFILSLFGEDTAPDVDEEGATLVDEIASALDERLTDIFA